MALSLLATNIYGQVTKSPFTDLGVGDVIGLSLINQHGMAGAGLASDDPRYINIKNPAMLHNNRVYTFSAGMIGERRTISDGTNKTTGTGGNLSYLATTFPIKSGRWTTGIGLLPYSRVGYRYTFTDDIAGSPENVSLSVTKEGSGGINELYWSHGVKINDYISLGAKASYLFSSIKTEYTNQVIGADFGAAYKPAVSVRDAFSDFAFSGSIAAGKDIKKDLRLNLGFVYDFKTDIQTRRLTTLERRLVNDINIDSDTLSKEVKGITRIPDTYNFGLSLSKKFRWSVSLDLKRQNWSKFVNYDGSNDGLKDLTSIALGAEITPDPFAVDNYLKRVTYRVGVSSENTPYTINNNQVNDFGINFGWSLPVSNISSLDMAFRYGRRGSVSENLVEEDYFRVYLGITFNDSRWFIKRKYD